MNQFLNKYSRTVLTLLIFCPQVSPSQGMPPATERVFNQFKNHIVQVRILEKSSESKSAIGSGFFIAQDGTILTNYHVVTDVVHHPDRYVAKVVLADGAIHKAELRHLDVIHDIAIIKIDAPSPAYFSTQVHPIEKGTRIYSMGNPFDLGLSIVEGTYNGLVEDSLYEKIHLTGSINPGMSGGPTLTANGDLVGVNVATAGNQVSFLVPARFVENLKSNYLKKPDLTLQQIKSELGDQIRINQDQVMNDLNQFSTHTVTLGSYSLPGQINRALKCWGDVSTNNDVPYHMVSHNCSIEDQIYITEQLSTGYVSFFHRYLSSDQLNTFRFASLVESYFETGFANSFASEQDVTKFECKTDFVDQNGISYKTVLCLRGYKDWTEIYDVLFRAASLNDSHAAILTELTLSGVDVKNAQTFIKHYLETIQWTK